MDRARLRKLVSEIAADLALKSYAEWSADDFPITFERLCEGREVTIELDLLAADDTKLEVAVCASTADWFCSRFPVTTSIVIRKPI